LQPEESLEHVLVSPRTMQSLEQVHACPQPDLLPATVLVSLQPQKPLERICLSLPR